MHLLWVMLNEYKSKKLGKCPNTYRTISRTLHTVCDWNYHEQHHIFYVYVLTSKPYHHVTRGQKDNYWSLH